MVWSPCQGGLQCGTLVVPLDYAHPDGPTIGIAVARHPAEVPAARIGSLVIDPGGPGVSGIDDMANELSSLTPQLVDDFDIVLFDPRGVERSDPVSCGSATGSAPSDPAPSTPSRAGRHHCGIAAVRGRLREEQPQPVAPRRVGRRRPRHGPAAPGARGQRADLHGPVLRHAPGADLCRALPDPHPGHGARQRDRPCAVVRPDHPGAGRRLRAHAQRVLRLVRRQHRVPVASRARTRPRALVALLQGRGDVTGAGRRRRQRRRRRAALRRRARLALLPVGVAAARFGVGRRHRRQRGAGGRAVGPLQHRRLHQRRRGGHRDRLPRPPGVAPRCASYGALAASVAASAPVFGPLLAWGEAGCAVWPVPADPDGRAGGRPGLAAHPRRRAPPTTPPRPTPGRSACPRSSTAACCSPTTATTTWPTSTAPASGPMSRPIWSAVRHRRRAPSAVRSGRRRALSCW